MRCRRCGGSQRSRLALRGCRVAIPESKEGSYRAVTPVGSSQRRTRSLTAWLLGVGKERHHPPPTLTTPPRTSLQTANKHPPLCQTPERRRQRENGQRKLSRAELPSHRDHGRSHDTTDTSHNNLPNIFDLGKGSMESATWIPGTHLGSICWADHRRKGSRSAGVTCICVLDMPYGWERR